MKFSNGWLQSFKVRHGVKQIKLHGESGSVDGVQLKIKIEEVRDQIKSFHLRDIFNADETALFYRLEPDQTLATKLISGKKINKDRITILLCTNADGSEKIEP